jgi:hypothetical protein
MRFVSHYRQVIMLFCAVLTGLFLTQCSSSNKISLAPTLPILSRAEWGSASPVMPMREHRPNRITIHHTAVKQNLQRSLADKLKALQRFSMKKDTLGNGKLKEAWADIPYHFYIAADGQVGEGRELKYIGDSNTPYDPTGHALIVLEGNFNVEQPSKEQYASLEKLTLALAQQYIILPEQISAHKDHADTECPGTNLYALIPKLKKSISASLKFH